jgi:hypothetical protein
VIYDDHVRAGPRPQFLVTCVYSRQAGLSLIFATKALIFMFKKGALITNDT